MRLATLVVMFGSLMLVQRDSARVVDGRVAVEPLGVSFRIPPVWMGLPDSTPGRRRSCLDYSPRPAVSTIVTARGLLDQLRVTPPNAWHLQFSQVVDSTISSSELVAHIGSVAWLGGYGCGGPTVRVYVTAEAPDAIHARAQKPRITIAQGTLFPPSAVSRDSAEWKFTTVNWGYNLSDQLSAPHVDFVTRRVRGRTLLVVLMGIGTLTDPDMWSVLRSVLIAPQG